MGSLRAGIDIDTLFPEGEPLYDKENHRVFYYRRVKHKECICKYPNNYRLATAKDEA